MLNTVSGRLLACGPHAGLGRAGGAGRGSVWVRSQVGLARVVDGLLGSDGDAL